MLRDAIRTVHAGNAVLAPARPRRAARRRSSSARTPPPAAYLALTDKEREVFAAVAHGLSNTEIGGAGLRQRVDGEDPRRRDPAQAGAARPGADRRLRPRARARRRLTPSLRTQLAAARRTSGPSCPSPGRSCAGRPGSRASAAAGRRRRRPRMRTASSPALRALPTATVATGTPGRHLHDREQGVHAVEVLERHGDADHRQRRDRGEHAGQVGRSPGAGDDHRQAARRRPRGRRRASRRASGAPRPRRPRRRRRTPRAPRPRPPSPASRSRSPSRCRRGVPQLMVTHSRSPSSPANHAAAWRARSRHLRRSSP